MKKKVLSVVLVFLMVFTFSACKPKDADKDEGKYSVTFDLNYKGAAKATVVEVEKDTAVSKPSDPVRNGYDFKHWTLDGAEFDFETKINKDITLKASWDEAADTEVTITGVQRIVEIEIGDDYDPLAGVTAKDGDGNSLNQYLKHTFNEEWLSAQGNYRYEVYVEIEGNKEASVRVAIQVLGAESRVIVMEYPELITHYIGSAFDPLSEVVAYDVSDRTTEYPVSLKDWDDYMKNNEGKHEFTVVATDDDGKTLEKTITLTTKTGVAIPSDISKGKTVSIDMWHSNGSAIETALKGYATDFEAMMAQSGYTVKVNILKPASTYDELRTTVVNALKGAELPHLVQNYPDHVVEYNSHGAIKSLLPYINHPTWGMNPDIEEESFGDILESYRREQRAVTLDGDYLSLPFNKSTEVVAYNKDMFKAVLGNNPFPRTWQELFSYGPALMSVKDDFIDDIALKWQASGDALSSADIQKVKDEFVPFAYDSKGNAFITLTRQFGGQYTGRDARGNGELLFDSTQVRSMLNYFGSNNDIFNIPEVWDTNYASDMFKKGYAALAIGSTGGIRYNTPVNKGTKLFDIGVAPMFYDANNPGRKSVIQQGTNISLTNRGTAEEQLVAWLFLKYLTSKEVQEDFSIITGYSPVRNSVYTNERFLTYLDESTEELKANYTAQGLTQAKYNTLFENYVKALALTSVSADRSNLFFDTPFVGSSAARNAVGIAFERVMLRGGDELLTSIDHAIQYAWDEASKVLER